MITITKRPPTVEDRAVPGQLEGDLLMGRNGHHRIALLRPDRAIGPLGENE